MRKRVLSLLLALTMVLSLLPAMSVTASAATADTGWYTEETDETVGASASKPYILHNYEDLEGLASLTNAETFKFQNKFVKLADDFPSGGTATEMTISIANFEGVFDGNQRTVKLNLTAGVLGDGIIFVGLFSSLSGTTAVVKNLKTEGSITISDTSRKVHAGGITGRLNQSVLDSCSSAVSIAVTASAARVGGLAGEVLNASIKNCSCSGSLNVTSEGETPQTSVGGIVGYLDNNNSIIANSFAISSITESGKNQGFVGGAVGWCLGGSVCNCYAVPTKSGSPDKFGGLFGTFASVADHCYSTEATLKGQGSGTVDVSTNCKQITAADMKLSTGADAMLPLLNQYVADHSAKGYKKWTISASENGGYPQFLNPVCEITVCADNTDLVGEQYASIAEALTAAGTNAATIQMIADTTLDATIEIIENADVTLDLNDKVIDCNGKRGFHILTGGKLTLEDNATNKTTKTFENPFEESESVSIIGGMIVAAGTYGNGAGVLNEGTFVMKSGNIVGCTCMGTEVYGGGVYTTGDFTMEGGRISYCFSIWHGGVAVGGKGSFTMTDGEISNCVAYIAGGGAGSWSLSEDDAQTISLEGGSISNNCIMEGGSPLGGAGLLVGPYATATIKEGFSVKNNSMEIEEKNQALGAGILVYTGTLNMEGGAVVKNEAVNKYATGSVAGGGICNYRGTLNISGGTISENTASGAAMGVGGGIGNMSGKVTITGGTISENKLSVEAGTSAIAIGGGICNYWNATGGPEPVSISGCTITGNTVECSEGFMVGGGGIFNIMYEMDLSNCSVTGNKAPNAGGVYDVMGGTTVSGKVIVKDNTLADETTASNFVAATPMTIGTLSTDTLIGVTLPDEEMASTSGAFTTNGASTDTKYFFSDDDGYIVKYVAAVGTEGSGDYKAAHLELTDEIVEVTANGTTKGYKTISDALKHGGDATTLETNEKKENPTVIKLISDITENVVIPSTRFITLDLNGYVLKANGDNAAIHNNGTLTIKDSNTANISHLFTVNYDGVWDFSEEEAENIDYTFDAQGLKKEGVATTDIPEKGQIIEVTGGCITGVDTSGEAEIPGGGVYNKGNLTIESGNLVGNSSGTYGGGVYNEANGMFTMNGGNIVGNETNSCGGGVYNEENATFTMKSGCISYNKADLGGVGNYGSFVMDGGQISFNETSMGGGVKNSGTFTMNGGMIHGNSSFVRNSYGSYAGGVNNEGTFTMKGGEISANTSVFGGGVRSGSVFTMDGGTITGNIAISYWASVEGYYGNQWADGVGAGVLIVDGSVTIGGTANISENQTIHRTFDGYDETTWKPIYNETERYTENLYLSSGTLATVDTGDSAPVAKNAGNPTAKYMQVGVTLFSGTGQFTTNGTSTDKQFFFSDNTVYKVKFNNNGTDTDTTDDYLELANYDINAVASNTASVTLEKDDMTDTQAIAIAKAQKPKAGLSKDTVIAYAKGVSEGKYAVITANSTTDWAVGSEMSLADMKAALSATSNAKAVFVIGTVSNHTHDWTYKDHAADSSVAADTLTATCGATGHTGDTTETLTVSAPLRTTYGDTSKSADAVLSKTALGEFTTLTVKYQTYNDSTKAWSTAAATAPTDAGKHKVTVSVTKESTTYSAEKEYTIDKATPTVTTVPTATAITYGQTLADSKLSGGTGSVPGSFAWKNGSTKPTVSNSGYTVVFTPNDSNYATSECTVTPTVKKATPTYKVPAGLSCSEGRTLANITLPEGFSWEEPGTTPVGELGTHTFHVKYTPSDTANYNVVEHIEVTVKVCDKATMTISGSDTARHTDVLTYTVAFEGERPENTYVVWDVIGAKYDYVGGHIGRDGITIFYEDISGKVQIRATLVDALGRPVKDADGNIIQTTKIVQVKPETGHIINVIIQAIKTFFNKLFR